MPDTVMNIYKTSRLSAGITQENAAILLHVSVRTLAAYESGERIPSEDIVVRMMDRYNDNDLGGIHLRQTSELARRIIPTLGKNSPMAASVKIHNNFNRLMRLDGINRLMEIGEDNVIDDTERGDFTTIAHVMQLLSEGILEMLACGNEDQEDNLQIREEES